MKHFIPVFLLLVTQQSFACIRVENASICNGDTVFKGSTYTQGGTVVAENQYSQQVTVKSRLTGSLTIENARELDVTSGCFGQLCVGDKVLKGSTYTQGATIVGVNFANQTFTVKSILAGSLSIEEASNLDSTTGCLENVCVGDKVYKGATYSQGGIVAGINSYHNTITVKSVLAGSLTSEDRFEIDVAKGCLGNICVGDKVYKGTSYSQGAIVMAINQANYRATVKSVVAGSLDSESIYELQGTRDSREPNYPPSEPSYPRDPRGPSYPRDPREPSYPRDPRGPSYPRDPRGPREPQRPTQITEQCTVQRLDPAGMFITSYTRSFTGSPMSNVKDQACRIAMSDCSMEAKGRQSCSIAR